MPGIIQSFDPVHQTAVVQPALMGWVTPQSGIPSWVKMPLLVDCPVQFPRGGGVALTFPVAAGDECLVVFANRCIDAWWQLGGIQVQAELRMNDLSDGMVILGFNSVPNVMSGVSTSAAQLRDASGDTFVSVSGGGIVQITAASQVGITAPAITLNGPVTCNGGLTVTGAVNLGSTLAVTGAATLSGGAGIAGQDFGSHYHGGVQTGSGNTGGPL